jgi:sugar lactone lactonase YvrE
MGATSVRTAELVLDMRNQTGESPVWHAGEQSLYWVDIPEKKLFAYRVADQYLQQWNAPEMLACIVPAKTAGQWIAGAESGMFALDTTQKDSLGFTPLASVEHAMAGMRFNDGRCDRQGRFLAGTMLMDMGAAAQVGAIYQFDETGSLKKLLSGFITPNGMAFSPGGATMYLSDSHPTVRKVWAYDYDTASGKPSNPRPFIDMTDFAGRPDGAAMDTDGCYWICGNDAGLIHRYTPAGELDFSVSVPVPKPAMCAFGGGDLRTLYITSIRPGNAPQDRLDGAVFAIHLSDVQGFPEPAYNPA